MCSAKAAAEDAQRQAKEREAEVELMKAEKLAAESAEAGTFFVRAFSVKLLFSLQKLLHLCVCVLVGACVRAHICVCVYVCARECVRATCESMRIVDTFL